MSIFQPKLDLVLERISNGERITNIDLSSCHLQSFPNELFQLSDCLEVLNLGNNELNHLPVEIIRFQKLRILFFGSNKFTSIPPELGQLNSLYMLSFKSNYLTHIAAESLSPSIGWLILTDNKLTTLPNNIGTLRGLRKLMLAGNELADLPESLNYCQDLELLRISCNCLQTLPLWLLEMPKLSWLAISGNASLTATDPQTSLVHEDVPIVAWDSLELGAKLGEGASGTIYKASLCRIVPELNMSSKSGILSEPVAVKVFRGEATSDGSPEDEMKACLAAGQHASLVSVLSRVGGGPSPALVFPLLAADTCNLGLPPSFVTVTRDTYSLDTKIHWTSTVAILISIASAIHHLHGRSLTHGDLYAHNIVVDSALLSGKKTTLTTLTQIAGNCEVQCNEDIDIVINSDQTQERLSFNAVLCDFGAASSFAGQGSGVAQRLMAIEIRAFGCLLDDLLSITAFTDGDINGTDGCSNESSFIHSNLAVRSSLSSLRDHCLFPNWRLRPSSVQLCMELIRITRDITQSN